VTKSPDETERVGEELAATLSQGDVVGLVGELGSGKTCFVRGLARGFGAKDYIKSPSFTIVNVYEGARGGSPPLYHIDLYRIGTEDEFYGAGIDEFLNSKGVSVIEWADRIPGLLADCTVVVRFSHVSEGERRLEIERAGAGG
jgi:tRNA threonylcarbamoyladenosine biosynthesis protein TsaE